MHYLRLVEACCPRWLTLFGEAWVSACGIPSTVGGRFGGCPASVLSVGDGVHYCWRAKAYLTTVDAFTSDSLLSTALTLKTPSNAWSNDTTLERAACLNQIRSTS
jgi:hypothetical protein